MLRFRLWLGGLFQTWAWFLCDPHDAWSIEYAGLDGAKIGVTHVGHYSKARKFAKLKNGKVVGWRTESYEGA